MGLFEIIVIFLWIIDLVTWWLCAHALPSKVGRGWRWALHLFFAAQVAFLAVMCLNRGANLMSWVPVPAFVFFYVWHLLIAPVVLVIGLLGLLGEAALAIRRFFRPEPEVLYAGSEGLSRREFLGAVAALTPPVLTFSVSAFAFQQLSTFRVRRLTVTLPTVPPELDGMTIALLTDLHLGQFTQGRVLKEIIETTNGLKPDLTLFAGDLINSSVEVIPQAIETLKAIESPLFLCEGNHDVSFNRTGFERPIKVSGLRLLQDEAALLQIRGVPVQVFGIRWEGPRNWQKQEQEHALAHSVKTALQARDPAAFPILLAHHPHAWDYCGEIPLTVAGHTHGGQLMLTDEVGFGPWMFRYWSGLYTRNNAATGSPQALVVSNGVGNWFPIRTAAPAEIVHITLRRG